MEELPPLPEGFSLVEESVKEADSIPPLPEGFTLVSDEKENTTPSTSLNLETDIINSERDIEISRLEELRDENNGDRVDLAIKKAHLKAQQEEQKFIDSKQAPIPNKEGKQDESIVNQFSSFYNEVREASIEPFSPAIDLALHKAKSMGSALGETFQLGVNEVFNTDFDFYEKNSEKLREEGKRLNNVIDPEGKLGMSPVSMTDLVSSIAIPLGVTNPVKMVALEGLLGFTTAMQEDLGFTESVKSGVTQSGASAVGVMGVEKIIGMINKKGTGKALDYLWDRYENQIRQSSGLSENATKDEIVDAIEQDWLSVMSGSSSANNKVRALVDRLGATGASIKKNVQEVVDIADEKMIGQPKIERVSELRTTVEGGDIKEASEELGRQVGVGETRAMETVDDILINKEVSEEVADRATPIFMKRLRKGKIAEVYSSFAKAMKNKYTGTYNLGQEAKNLSKFLSKRSSLAGGLSPVETRLGEALSEPMTIDNMMRIKSDINTLVDSTTGVAQTNAIKLRGDIEKTLVETLSKEDHKLFGSLDKEWANRSKILGSKEINEVGAKLMAMANGNKTMSSIISDLDSLNTGRVDFKQLEKVIGTKNIKKLETGIIKNLIKGDIDDVSYSVVDESLSKMGFITKEGKEVKKIIDKMNTVFSADNFALINKGSMGASEKDAVALTADLAQKLKYTASSAIFKRIKKAFFTTKESEELRHVEDLAEILTEKNIFAKKMNIGGKEVEGDKIVEIVRDSIFDAYRTQIKAMNKDADINEEEVKKVIDKSFGMKLSSTKGKPVVTKGGNVNIGSNKKATKEVLDKTGGMMLSTTKGKPVVTKGASGAIKQFIEDVANPKVNVNSKQVADLHDALKAEGTTMSEATVAKEKAWKEAMKNVGIMRGKKNTTAKDRDNMIKAVKDYFDKLEDTI